MRKSEQFELFPPWMKKELSKWMYCMNCPPIIYDSPFHFFRYYCSDCDLEYSFKSKYDRHLESKGHCLAVTSLLVLMMI